LSFVLSIRACYRAATLGPLAGLAVAAALARPSAALPAGWDWVYPTSVTRGLIAYALLAVWLWIEIGRRPLPEIRRLVWWAPVLYVALSWVLMLSLTLLRGTAGEVWAEHTGAIALRTAVHLVAGYGYVALVHVVLNRLRSAGEIADAP
jgi:hypothetical protein